MKVPQLRKKLEIKSCHSTTWEDNYSWIHQKNILEVLKDKNKLDPEVKEYLTKENEYTQHHLRDTKDIQKNLFEEIKFLKDADNFILLPFSLTLLNTPSIFFEILPFVILISAIFFFIDLFRIITLLCMIFFSFLFISL